MANCRVFENDYVFVKTTLRVNEEGKLVANIEGHQAYGGEHKIVFNDNEIVAYLHGHCDAVDHNVGESTDVWNTPLASVRLDADKATTRDTEYIWCTAMVLNKDAEDCMYIQSQSEFVKSLFAGKNVQVWGDTKIYRYYDGELWNTGKINAHGEQVFPWCKSNLDNLNFSMPFRIVDEEYVLKDINDLPED